MFNDICPRRIHPLKPGRDGVTRYSGTDHPSSTNSPSNNRQTLPNNLSTTHGQARGKPAVIGVRGLGAPRSLVVRGFCCVFCWRSSQRRPRGARGRPALSTSAPPLIGFSGCIDRKYRSKPYVHRSNDHHFGLFSMGVASLPMGFASVKANQCVKGKGQGYSLAD